MQQAVTVYRWDDAGAPQIGSGDLLPGILNILKKCLVEGYGTKAAAGWTVEYEDVAGAKCVFRNDPIEGSGGYVQFQKAGDNALWFKCGTSMTGIDEYIHPGYMSSLAIGTIFNDAKWILIASATAAYFSLTRLTETLYSSSPNFNMIFFGDIISFIKNDPGTFCTIGHQSRNFTSAITSVVGNNSTSNLHAHILNTNFYSNSPNPTEAVLMLPLSANGEPSTIEHILCTPNYSSSNRNTDSPFAVQQTDKMYISLISNVQQGVNFRARSRTFNAHFNITD